MNIELVSVHIPKTAGTSFRRALEQVYGADAIFHDNGEYTDVLEMASMPLEPRHRVIHGHVWAGRYKSLLPHVEHVTWVRHPVDWLISLYAFIDSLEPNPSPLWIYLKNDRPSLLEFAAFEGVRDHSQSRFLARVPLDAFSFVGIQEHFADDLSSFFTMKGWQCVEMPRENSNPVIQEFRSQVWSDRAIVDGICDRLGSDMRLYEEALQKRNRRLQGAVAA